MSFLRSFFAASRDVVEFGSAVSAAPVLLAAHTVGLYKGPESRPDYALHNLTTNFSSRSNIPAQYIQKIWGQDKEQKEVKANLHNVLHHFNNMEKAELLAAAFDNNNQELISFLEEQKITTPQAALLQCQTEEGARLLSTKYKITIQDDKTSVLNEALKNKQYASVPALLAITKLTEPVCTMLQTTIQRKDSPTQRDVSCVLKEAMRSQKKTTSSLYEALNPALKTSKQNPSKAKNHDQKNISPEQLLKTELKLLEIKLGIINRDLKKKEYESEPEVKMALKQTLLRYTTLGIKHNRMDLIAIGTQEKGLFSKELLVTLADLKDDNKQEVLKKFNEESKSITNEILQYTHSFRKNKNYEKAFNEFKQLVDGTIKNLLDQYEFFKIEELREACSHYPIDFGKTNQRLKSEQIVTYSAGAGQDDAEKIVSYLRVQPGLVLKNALEFSIRHRDQYTLHLIPMLVGALIEASRYHEICSPHASYQARISTHDEIAVRHALINFGIYSNGRRKKIEETTNALTPPLVRDLVHLVCDYDAAPLAELTSYFSNSR